MDTPPPTGHKRSILHYCKELVIALAFALAIATVIRSMWFEPYEIPTGSMRPTFREQDHLTVTKTAFGINIPLETKHFYFDPALVQRTSVVIFSGDGMPISDVDTVYFGIFPYKKRFIKRCIGKPGDSIYFYGGRLYGVDKEGNDLAELRETPWMQALEYVPFLSFQGDHPSLGAPHTLLLRQMHKAYGKLLFYPNSRVDGEVFNGKGWVKDQPLAQKKPHNAIQTYSDLFGFRNYAETRLLTKNEMQQLVPNSEEVGEGILYLQLRHTPSLSYPPPSVSGNSVNIPGYSTVIPLTQEHLNKIMDNLYTARFVISDEKARRYSLGESHDTLTSPPFLGFPDGTYEFYFGEVSKIHWAGVPTSVPHDTLFYSRAPENVYRFFNLGIEMDTNYLPSPYHPTRYPHRYAYFRDGALYLMGAPILAKDDPVLIAFHEKEKQREAASTDAAPYVAFRDYGPPLKEGHLDVEFVRTFGVTIPEKHYFVLGDNHAMSGDSRVFGFVPENNLQGAPYWIIWPPGDRLGPPPQKPYPFMNTPRAIVWSCAAVACLLWYIYSRYRKRVSNKT